MPTQIVNVPWMVSSLMLVFLLMVPPTVVSLDVAMETKRAANAALRTEIRNRGVAKEKVAPIQTINGKEVVPVKIDLGVVSILAMNDFRQSMDSAIFLRLGWQDPSLTWNVSEHGGVKSVELRPSSVWTPDIRVANSYELLKVMDGADTLFLSHTGNIQAQLSIIVTTACVMDLSYYPYDEQVCTIFLYTFSTSLNIAFTLDNNIIKLATANFVFGNEWIVVGSKIEMFSMNDSTHYPKLLMTLRRKTTYYTVCLVLPMVLTSYMNTLVFLLPLQSGEKISFLVSIFVSTSVFISYFTRVMPRGLDSVPNVMILLLGVLIESVLIFLATILVLHLQYRQSKDTQPTGRTTYHASHDNAQTTSNSSATETHSEGDTFNLDAGQLPNLHHENVAPFVQEREKKPILSRVTLSLRNLTAKDLDRVFFILAFVGNSIFFFYLSVLSTRS